MAIAKTTNTKLTMSKINIEDVAGILLKQSIDPKVVQTVVKELSEVAEDEKEARSGTPKQKNEFLFVLSDPDGRFAGEELTGWVVQIKQGDDACLVLDKIRQAARDTNASKKRKRNMIKDMPDAFRATKRSFLKAKNVMIKTKEPVRVLVTDGKLDQSEHSGTPDTAAESPKAEIVTAEEFAEGIARIGESEEPILTLPSLSGFGDDDGDSSGTDESAV